MGRAAVPGRCSSSRRCWSRSAGTRSGPRCGTPCSRTCLRREADRGLPRGAAAVASDYGNEVAAPGPGPRPGAALRGGDDGDAGGLPPLPHRPVRGGGGGGDGAADRARGACGGLHPRDRLPRGAPGSPAADCSGERSGNLYLQYWFYYPGSATGEGSTPLKGAIRNASSAMGKPSLSPGRLGELPGADRARRPPLLAAPARTTATGRAARARGSDRTLRLGRQPRGPGRGPRRPPDHQGRPPDPDPAGRIARTDSTPVRRTPPWRKRVYLDPEYEGTD